MQLKKGCVIRPFDPWGSHLCTCPPKYSFDPYTGCQFHCVYCYSTSYIPNFQNCRLKDSIIQKVLKDLKKIGSNILISMSNSSDPYPHIESRLMATRRCLEIFRDANVRLLIITKSDLVTRDIDMLSEMRCAVTLTITTLKKDISSILEPNAVDPLRRIEVIKTLADHKIPVGMRVDPIIPFLNDSENDLDDLLGRARRMGVSHITSSTLKVRFDSWRRLEKEFPNITSKLNELYFTKGSRVGRSYYLPTELRFDLMLRAKKVCDKYGLSFACCREGFREIHTANSCDGSHLI